MVRKQKLKFKFRPVNFGREVTLRMDSDETPRMVSFVLAHYFLTKGRGNCLTESLKDFVLRNEDTSIYVPAAGKKMRLFSSYFAFKYYLALSIFAGYIKRNEIKPTWATDPNKRYPRFISATSFGKIKRLEWLEILKKHPTDKFQKYSNTRCWYVLKKAFLDELPIEEQGG
ncbi:MAG: hypothetical protein HYW50_00425 [Candidatus Diapherotrites archaeon]|nr:hypothetical protein [Candidatus Diapherotrites archaeon]